MGPLGLAQDGSGIGVSRWMSEGGEVMEVFFQVSNLRLFRNVPGPEQLLILC